jgi:methyl-accepting chemotaxis protein PixJ
MTQTSPKKNQQTEQSNGSNGQIAATSLPFSSDSEQELRYIPLQDESQQQSQEKQSWWRKLIQRWDNISFRNKLTIIVIGSAAIPVIAITQI